MTDDFAYCPFILWKIKDITVPQTTISPTISFMEMEWELKFNNTYYESSDVKQVYLLLVRLTPPSFSLLETPFQIETGIQDVDGGRCMKCNITSKLENEHIYIWTDNIANIQNYYSRGKNVTFYIQVNSVSLLYLSGEADDASTCTIACEKHLFESYRKLVKVGEPPDIVLKCRDKKLPVHRAILAARSPIFAAMFRSGTKGAQKKFVEMKGVEPDVLEKILRYMNSGAMANFPRIHFIRICPLTCMTWKH